MSGLWLFILIRVVANSFSNAFQKLLTQRSLSPLFIIMVTHGIFSLACVPVFYAASGPKSTEFWYCIAAGAVLGVAGNLLIVQALQLSDLSVLGPINAYKPIVSLIPGFVLLGETPGPIGFGGMVMIVLGSYFLVPKSDVDPHANPFVRFFRDRGVRFRFAALIFSATDAVFLKKAILASSPGISFAYWSLIGWAVSFVLLRAKRSRDQLATEVSIARRNKSSILMAALTMACMQLCTFVVFAGLQVGPALALFQLSAILSVVIGHSFFQEPDFGKRVTGALVMGVGAACILCDS